MSDTSTGAAIYKTMQDILTAALGEYKDKGFTLYEWDDHVLALDYQDETIAIFSTKGATIEAVREHCQRFLNGK